MRAQLVPLSITLLLAILFVVSTPDFSVAVLVIWLTVILLTSFFTRRSYAELAVQAGVFAAVTMLAYWAPVKTTNENFARRVRLPKTVLSLAEIAELADDPTKAAFPVHLSIACGNEVPSTKVEFHRHDLTLGAFVSTIEDQTRLRHRFQQCANGYTILWGYEPSFCLSLSEPTR